jgi:hypothetical protein
VIRRFLILARRALGLLGVVAVLYFVIGSLIFPPWYYWLFWDRGFAAADAQMWAGGVKFWVETPILPTALGMALRNFIVIAFRSPDHERM